MSLLSKEALETALRSKPTIDVKVPELGGSIRIRTLTGAEREQWEHDTVIERKENRSAMRARMVAMAVVDENGKQMWNEIDVTNTLSHANAVVLDRLFDAALKFNSLDPGTRERLLKNSASGQSLDSGTNSPDTSAKA